MAIVSESLPHLRFAITEAAHILRISRGSFTIYIQHDNPGPDKESNGLPAPAGPFYMFMRDYAPDPKLMEALKNLDTFEGPPPVVLVK